MRTKFILMERFSSKKAFGIIGGLNASVLLFLLMFILGANNPLTAQNSMPVRRSVFEGERLRALIDFKKLEADIMDSTGMSAFDYAIFDKFISRQRMSEEINFFPMVRAGKITLESLPAYVEQLKKSYLALYPEFNRAKPGLILADKADVKRVAEVNGPCTNIDFEEGTFRGWEGIFGNHSNPPTNDPVNPQSGFDLHCIMTPNMVDPLVPGLPVTAPGSDYSIRLGNTVNGGHAAKLSQTFRVDSANMIFTYRYAVVLEDPGDHSDNERPYFKVRMYDQNNKIITCASYTVIVKNTIQGYNRICVDADGDMPGTNNGSVPNNTPPAPIINTGCPPNTSNTTAGNVPPVRSECPNNTPGGITCCPDDNLDIYYKTWTTVSIPLNAYYNQNVRIEFISADCEPNGHLGYAYIDADCSPFTVLTPGTICTTSGTTQTLTAPNGFASYAWTGPPSGIAGGSSNGTVSNNQIIVAQRPGIYKVTLTPFSDAPCPVTTSITIMEKCPPPPYTVNLCETVKGSGTVPGVNLNTYRSLITNYLSPAGTVVSWHTSSLSPTANFVTSPTNLTVSTGSKFYAFVDHVSPFRESDMVELNFVVNPKPTVVFPDVAPVCVNSPAFQIPGVTPANGTGGTGVFSSTTPNVVTAAGLFSPSVAGSFVVKYKFTTTAGCPDSLSKTIVVQPKPGITVGPGKMLCEDNALLTLTGTVNTGFSAIWSGGAGTHSPNATTVNNNYTPTAAEIASGTITLTLKSTVVGTYACPMVSAPVTYTFEKLPVVNAGPNQDFCTPVASVTLAATITNSATWLWTKSGTITPSNSLTGSYVPTPAEISAGSATLTLKSTGTTVCPAATDEVVFSFGEIPVANAGADQPLCASATGVILTGAVTNASGGIWTTSGNGTFSPNANTLGATYIPSTADKNSGLVILTLKTLPNGLCPVATDQMEVTFEKIPAVNAGPAQEFCVPVSTVTLSASVTNSAIWQWTASGNISPSNSLTGSYSPTIAELAAGSATLTLTSTGTSICPAASEEVKFTFGKVPAADAGPDQPLCASVIAVPLSGTVENVPGGVWSTSGSGTFSPDNNTMTAAYLPSAGDKASGLVTLTLTTLPVGTCPTISDEVEITFEKIPAVDAGPDQPFCANTGPINLNASVTNSATWSWTGGAGAFSTSGTLTGTYTPAAAELASGIVTLTLKSTGTTICPAVSEEVKFTFEAMPAVNAGPDINVCANNISIQLFGDVTNASGAKWSGGMGQIMPNNTDLHINYLPTPAEIAAGLVNLTLTSTGNTYCPAATDPVDIIITPAPTIDAGFDQIVCADFPTVNLDGKVTVAMGAHWSNGTGSYNPGSAFLNPEYTPSLQEIGAGKAKLILISSNNGKCLPVADSMEITIIPIPVVDPGANKLGCDGTNFLLEVENLPGIHYSWTIGSTPTGTNSNQLPVTATTGDQKYFVTATGLNNCSYSDSIVVSGIPIPVIHPKDSAVCPNVTVAIDATPSNISAAYTSGLKYEWSKDGVLIGGNQAIYQAAKPGLYSVKASIGSCSDTESANITWHPSPAPFMPESVKFCPEADQTITLDAGPAAKYFWKPTSDTTRIINVTAPGIYYVIVSNQFNCTMDDEVLVREVCPPRLFISNAFSPNADSENNMYNVYGVHFINFHMLIFNRWGEVIFESKHRNQVWDGTYRGEPYPIGVYPWIITYEGDTEEFKGPYKLEGSVTVVK